MILVAERLPDARLLAGATLLGECLINFTVTWIGLVRCAFIRGTNRVLVIQRTPE